MGKKQSVQFSVAVTSTLATTRAIRITDQVVGQLYIPTGSSITSLTWYSAPTEGGTYLICYDAGTNGVQTVAGGRSYRLPLELAGAAILKAVGNADGSIIVNLKS